MRKIKKENSPIRQHYIPQVYLRNFCTLNDSIVVWDKKSKKIFSTGINAVGVERDFYTLDKLDDPYYWEHTYANGVEPLMGKVIPQILSRANLLVQSGTVIISPIEKAHLAIIMVMQMLRGKQCREYERKIFEDELPSIINAAKQTLGNFTEQELEFIEAFRKDEFYFKRSVMDAALSPDRIIRYAKILCMRSFICFYLRGTSEFVTSDNPVMFFNQQTANSSPFSHGLLQIETGVCYPLSPKLLLYAVHPASSLKMLVKSDCCLVTLNSNQEIELVKSMNRMQTEQCYRQTYAKSGKALNSINNSEYL